MLNLEMIKRLQLYIWLLEKVFYWKKFRFYCIKKVAISKNHFDSPFQFCLHINYDMQQTYKLKSPNCLSDKIIIKLLIKKGANVNSVDEIGWDKFR